MVKVRVAVVDDHTLFRDGLSDLLNNKEHPLKVVLRASNGKDLLEQLVNIDIDVVLLDIDMPILNGTETLNLLKLQYPSIKIIMLTLHDYDRIIFDMIEKGADGFLLKSDHLDMVVDAVVCVVQKGIYLNNRTRTALKNIKNNPTENHTLVTSQFSLREREIIFMICKEMTNKEISKELNISKRTVETHRIHIMSKIGCKNTAGIVFYSIKNSLVQL